MFYVWNKNRLNNQIYTQTTQINCFYKKIQLMNYFFSVKKNSKWKPKICWVLGLPMDLKLSKCMLVLKIGLK